MSVFDNKNVLQAARDASIANQNFLEAIKHYQRGPSETTSGQVTPEIEVVSDACVAPAVLNVETKLIVSTISGRMRRQIFATLSLGAQPTSNSLTANRGILTFYKGGNITGTLPLDFSGGTNQIRRTSSVPANPPLSYSISVAVPVTDAGYPYVAADLSKFPPSKQTLLVNVIRSGGVTGNLYIPCNADLVADFDQVTLYCASNSNGGVPTNEQLVFFLGIMSSPI